MESGKTHLEGGDAREGFDHLSSIWGM